ncbi:short-chain dehydrogenase [Thermopolyspora flexuosa]|uniref:NAD(P)-dependent dehydrogenase (Short-subunit alcohol dehydrogenase family) n=1 Tax=Thermopolyspora flexuosa TaxID=103836 RepID=A0A543IPN9_9ACTN|nr:SDR family oxidoreductase [Thermopolyspora flexuosa]TQM72530.1 NAD(P)-dependent dehydrogenase (short-subunit alcohol dehydrogenase family) [Thermopolyspora flexuosa]GGM69845.1 short-chain dehydrogenase [Thermopolyspora flexuosa]
MAGSVVVVGGTAGIGRELAAHYAARGREVVLTGRDQARADKVAAELGPNVRGVALDLARPGTLRDALAGVGPVDHLALVGIERDANTVADYDVDAAVALVTMKLVGYTEVVHVLRDRLTGDGSVLLFGGMARLRPYPGSTTVSTINAGVVGLVRTLSVELAPIRVNSIHPGIVGDSPFWAGKPPEALEGIRAGTLTGRLVTMADVVDAARFLLENPGVNGVDLTVDGGWR